MSIVNKLRLLWVTGICIVVSSALVAADVSVRQPRAAADVNQEVADTQRTIHSLIDNPDCKDLKELCVAVNRGSDNLSILECIHDLTPARLAGIPDACQHAIWQEQRIVQSTDYVTHTLLPAHCAANQQELSACMNAVDQWACLKEKTEHLANKNQCRSQVLRVFAILSPDFELVGQFYTACGNDVDHFKCGRLNAEKKPISQLETVECLQEAGAAVSDQRCRLVIENVMLQKSILDLFSICQSDFEKFCSKETPGTPAAYKCLVNHKNEADMSHQCFQQISRRDSQIAKDYRYSRSLAKACKEDIKLHHCRRWVSEDKHVRLAQILLCLESVIKNGTQIDPDCRKEITDHRRMLMLDFQLSPEVLTECAEDIPKLCTEQNNLQQVTGNLEGGEIIHCLLGHVRKRRRNGRVTTQCQRALEALVKVSDVGEDWRVDPVLRRACKPVVDVACKDTEGGNARVMSCLMERLGTPIMLPDCEQSLLLIQYFVARDFKLDPQLYKHCRDDAIKYCRAKRAWDDVTDAQMDPERGPMIFPCLHRIAYNDDAKVTLRKDCYKEVKRVMRQRAVSVDLIPEVADVCINDLSLLCFDRTERGAEMECLQNNLDNLQIDCKKAVSKYTEEEAGHIELNPVIMSVCTDAMKKHCDHVLKGGKDKGEMMDCLISHKNDADLRQDLKCRAAIEHFQIISLKSYHFTYKFKEACRPYVARFCTASTTKNEVVACLSEVMRNDTIRGQRHTIPKECRQQVKSQLYQQRESIELDPKLANACKKELENLCADQKGPGQAVECLVQNTPRLGNACHHAIFMVKRSELGDSATDYTLVNTCKEMTYKFCAKTDSVHLLDCLKTYKDDPVFDPRCHLVVVNRMIEQNTDFRFNPTLQLACGKNIASFCSDIVATAQPNEELNGKVIQCLKNKFREARLDQQCAQEMVKILQEQALNYKLNPLLQNFCKSEIEVLCKAHMVAEEHGLVEECLKTAFLKQEIINRECRLEVATLIAEAKADIQVDPILEEACTVDLLRYCSKVKSGNGRKLKCLQVLLQDSANSLEEDCRLKLQRRIEMFRNADTVLAQPPEDMHQLVQQVVTSPARKFFLVILMTATGMVFLMGIFLGRATKRAMGLKNK